MVAVESENSVRVAFPQHHDKRDSLFHEFQTIHRLETTTMRGATGEHGIAGGIRVPTAAELQQWEKLLGSRKYDILVSFLASRLSKFKPAV